MLELQIQCTYLQNIKTTNKYVEQSKIITFTDPKCINAFLRNPIFSVRPDGIFDEWDEAFVFETIVQPRHKTVVKEFHVIGMQII